MCKCSVASTAAAAAAAWAGAEMDVMVVAMTMKDRADLARDLKALFLLFVFTLFDTLLNLMEVVSALWWGTLFNAVVG